MKGTNHPDRTALVAGATGLVGSHLLELLLKDKTYSKVIAILRKSLDLKNDKLEQVVISSFDELPAIKDKLMADDIFCCLGSTIKKAGSQEEFRKVDYNYPLELAMNTLKNGARQFLIITSIGADSESRVFYSRTKGEVEDEIMKLEFRSINIFRPSLILGQRAEHRSKEKTAAILFKTFAPFLINGLRKFRPIKAEDIAKAMLITAKEFHPGTDVFESDRIQSIADTYK